MKTVLAFMMGDEARARGAEAMVFDWDKAARLIRERQPERASAGLSGDWEWTGGEIYRSGDVVTTDYTYLASLWATPEIDLDGEIVECWVYQHQHPEWKASTKWPASARAILDGDSSQTAQGTVPEDYMGGDDGPWHEV